MVRRITTNGMMQSYKYNLMKSYNNLAGITEKVTTQRNFNSYAESPAKASQAFQLRRSRWNTENQIANSKQVRHKFQQAWDCLEDSYQDLGHKMANYSLLRAQNDPDAGGRQALGELIRGVADSMMETMNAKYGENFIFSGADGQTVPFSWGPDGEVLYRGMSVEVKAPSVEDIQKDDTWMQDPDYADFLKLYNTVEKEHTYVDLGMGMTEDANGKLIDSSAFDTALSGIDMIGYGKSSSVTLDDGTVVNDMPDNIISIIREIGDILSECSPEDGAYPTDPKYDQYGGAKKRVDALEKQLENKLNDLHANFVELDTRASFVEANELRLESMDDSLNEQIVDIEDIDPADAITALMWAQYSYNAALRIGTNILSQSLIDYMN
ncbi:hypothetical protein [Acutalibacter caecimuris]|uniref:hypothetical protein n=1 Tax=Acutalibacter caecimuris TaxID=3093657 RepID=UPI002AC92748|nr:hypothetical protein [Acutalibacter sp. M00118]